MQRLFHHWVVEKDKGLQILCFNMIGTYCIPGHMIVTIDMFSSSQFMNEEEILIGEEGPQRGRKN